MLQVSQDFRDEVDELHAFLETLAPEDWDRETGFMECHYFDVVSNGIPRGRGSFRTGETGFHHRRRRRRPYQQGNRTGTFRRNST